MEAYLFVNDIGRKRYRLLKKRYLTAGLEPRTHGNVGKTQKHALQYKDCEHQAVTFDTGST